MTEPAVDEVLCDVKDHVAYITLNRPHRSNAINQTLRSSLISLMAQVNDDDDIWAVVITGAGDRAFCAGGDLKEMKEVADMGLQPGRPMAGAQRNVYEMVLETYKPTIASLNGAAMGGGFELAMACDLRIAADHAILGLPEAKRSLGANFGSVLLPRLLPRAVALEMLYTAEPITASEAFRWGLVNRVVPAADLADTTEAMVRKIVGNAPLTLRRYKHMAVKAQAMTLHDALRLDVGPNPYLSDDRLEGARAFVEKRPPVWNNR